MPNFPYYTLDFETAGIKRRPEYPPKPVGFSLQGPDEETSVYYAWGHPTENNCSFEEAQAVLRKVWDSGIPILCQNAKFDYDVALTHMGVGELPWHLIHDTLYLLFLEDPHAITHSLKPSAERYLGLKPEEQEAVRDWLIGSQEQLRRDGFLPAGELIKPSNWGAYICLAPGGLVGKYADGDVLRTKLLFDKLYDRIAERGMVGAYDRERELMPILLRNEQEGVRVDVTMLQADYEMFCAAYNEAVIWLGERLGVPGLDPQKKSQLADALDNAGAFTNWTTTPTGKRSTKKDNMPLSEFNDKEVASVLGYITRLRTCLSTFYEPWLEMTRRTGRIYTSWNQVKQSKTDKDGMGARTGRMSSTPNFQNIPKDLEAKDDGFVHPEFLGLPELPLMRKYVIPDDEDSVIIHRDYSQQELRVLAHFEDGKLMERYQQNPRMDVHDFVRDEITRLTKHEYPRGFVKTVNFGIIYGMGTGAIASKLGITMAEAMKLRQAQGDALPGMKNLERTVSGRGKKGLHITTWGGRHYYAEPAKLIDGRMRSFEYKLLNYLIQGSSADITKQALIDYDKARKHGRFLITVHDEINISVPKEHYLEEMAILRKVMESIPLDAPLLSDGKFGPNWADMKKIKLEGEE